MVVSGGWFEESEVEIKRMIRTLLMRSRGRRGEQKRIPNKSMDSE